MEIIAELTCWKSIWEHLNTQRTLARPEQAACARGREQYWLQWEPDYRTRTYSPAVTDDRLWSYLTKLVPAAGLAQVFFGNRGIDWHRDAAYANSEAHLLSLGASTFEVEGFKPLQLKGGDLVRFDCKRRHRAYNVHPQRIGIGVWTPKIPLPS